MFDLANPATAPDAAAMLQALAASHAGRTFREQVEFLTRRAATPCADQTERVRAPKRPARLARRALLLVA